jgi:hypothetical protein
MCYRRQKLLAIGCCGPFHQGQLEKKVVKSEAFTEKGMKILAIVWDRPDRWGLDNLWESAIDDIGIPICDREVHD